MAAAVKRYSESYIREEPRTTTEMPQSIKRIAENLYKQFRNYNFTLHDTVDLQGGKYSIALIGDSANQSLYQIRGNNFTFPVYLAAGKKSGNVVVTHEKTKVELNISLLPMTEKMLTRVLSNFDAINDSLRTESKLEASENKLKNYIANNQVELKPLVPLKNIEISSKNTNRLSISEEISKKSVPLTDFSKELMVTAEVTFETKEKKKHYGKEEYKLKVFGQDNNKKYKEEVQKSSGNFLQIVFKYGKWVLILSALFKVAMTVKEHYIK